MLAAAAQSAVPRKRVDYVDWLRVIAVFLLLPFHSARLFDAIDSFYVKNGQESLVLTAFVGFLGSWHMPLLFVLAGAATWFALGFRGPGAYVLERFKRLLVPLAFGVLVVVPPQMYFAQRFHSGYQGSYFDYYPGFFQTYNGPDYPGIGFSYAHLWFILFLFVISLVVLPLGLLWRSGAFARVADRVASLLTRRGMLLVMAFPLILTSPFENPMGHDIALYLALFVYGLVVVSDERYQRAIWDQRWAATALAVAGTIGYLGLAASQGVTPDDDSFLGDVVGLLITVTGWFWIVAMMAFGQRWLNASNRLLRYANEAAYPVYILHQTVIVAIGYYVVQWQTDALLKWLVLVVLATAVTLGIYDLLVRRTNVSRFLFGMKRLPKKAEQAKRPSFG